MIIHKEIEVLKQELLALASLVEQRLDTAVISVQNRDLKQAVSVITSDSEIDGKEVDLEEECLKVLALHQPVAIDLRLIIAILKINNDLERIGDLAADIAERAKHLAENPAIETPFNCDDMSQKTQAMLQRSLDAFVNLDFDKAKDVCARDDAVDAIHSEMYDRIKVATREHPEHIDLLTSYLSVSRYLERIADHATNIAEDVMYLIEGNIVRHSGEIY
jgi:phosphate transport system protein